MLLKATRKTHILKTLYKPTDALGAFNYYLNRKENSSAQTTNTFWLLDLPLSAKFHDLSPTIYKVNQPIPITLYYDQYSSLKSLMLVSRLVF